MIEEELIMSKIYISQLFNDNEIIDFLKDRDIGLEIIEFGIGSVLDQEENGLSDYCNRMGDTIKKRSLSIHGPFLDLNPACYDSLVRNITMLRYNQVYSVAKKLGADRIIYHSCFNENIYFKESYVNNSIEFWKEFLKDKDDTIKIHIENVLESKMDHLIELIDAVNNKNLTLCLDIGHVNCYGKDSIETWIKRCGHRIGHVHLHNNDGVKDTHNGLSCGNIDIDTVLNSINKYCKDSSITIEINNYNELHNSINIVEKFFNNNK